MNEIRDECTNDVDKKVSRHLKRIKERLNVTKNASERLYLENALGDLREVKRTINMLIKLRQSKTSTSHDFKVLVRTSIA